MPHRDSFPRPEIIIFDMDGTLVDVTQSYRETTPLAATRYLALLGITPPPLTGDVYERFKLMGGFNDDWDLTAGLLEVLVAGLPPALPLPERAWADQDSLVTALQVSATPLAGIRPPIPEWAPLIARVQAAGGGFEGLRQVLQRHNAHLVWRTGDAATTDLVECIFSEIYLGEQLFAKGYGFPARYHSGPGLIERERLLISQTTLAALSRYARLGVATGRTRFEADYPLAHLDLAPFFEVVTTLDDAEAAQTPEGPSLKKPHPYLLQRAADTLDPPDKRAGHPRIAAYVGDAPDDIIAARQANGPRCWIAIGLADDPDLRSHYLGLGADLVLAHPDELLDVLGIPSA